MRWLTRLLPVLLVLLAGAAPGLRGPAGRPALRVDRLPRRRRSRRGSRRRCRHHQDAGAVLRLAEGHRLDGDLARRHRRGGARHAAAARQGDPDHLRRRLSQPLHPRLSAAEGLSLPDRGRPGRHLDGGRGRTAPCLRRRQVVPRSNFISWAEAREMQASGLVEFASHSYDLHRGVQANPQGNMTPSAFTWRYDPATRRYETDAQYARPHPRRPAALAPADRRQSWPAAARHGLAVRPLHGSGSTKPRRSASPSRSRSSPSPPTRPTCSGSTATIPRKTPPWATSPPTCASMPRCPATRRIVCLTLDALAAAGAGRPRTPSSAP